MRESSLEDLPVPDVVRAALREFLERVRERGGDRVRDVVLYGSMARGEAGPDSDVDVLVVWDGARMDARDVLSGAATDIYLRDGVDLAPHPVTPGHLAELEAMHTGFYQEVERDGIRVA